MSSKCINPRRVHEAIGAAQANELLAKGYRLIATHIAFSNPNEAKIHYVFGEDSLSLDDSDEDGRRPDELPIPRGRLG